MLISLATIRRKGIKTKLLTGVVYISPEKMKWDPGDQTFSHVSHCNNLNTSEKLLLFRRKLYSYILRSVFVNFVVYISLVIIFIFFPRSELNKIQVLSQFSWNRFFDIREEKKTESFEYLWRRWSSGFSKKIAKYEWDTLLYKYHMSTIF